MNDSPEILSTPKTKILGMRVGSFINLAIISGLTGFVVAFVAKNSYALFGAGQC